MYKKEKQDKKNAEIAFKRILNKMHNNANNLDNSFDINFEVSFEINLIFYIAKILF